MNRPNILFLVFDSLRQDIACDEMVSFRALAESNLRFDRAIAPAGWSLPSHASLFSGNLPHEHKCYRLSDYLGPTPLAEQLNQRGYRRYAVSANGYASPMYGFDDGFDTFYNTQGEIVDAEGLDVHCYVDRLKDTPNDNFDINTVDLARTVLTHDHPLKSAKNVSAATLLRLVRRFALLEHIPHPRFNGYSEFCYSPEQNTQIIESILKQEIDQEKPFFLFANYMDTHRPYIPPERHQRACAGRIFRYRELKRLNEWCHPWQFIERTKRNSVPDEEMLATVRALYRAEARSVDDHLSRVLGTLDQNGLLEETLVVVTADHGENLGERNQMGQRRMGHVASASDVLLNVPLVIANPRLPSTRVTDPVPLKELYSLFIEPEQFLSAPDDAAEYLLPDSGIVVSELPSYATPQLRTKYPDIPDNVFNRHLVAAFDPEWKVVRSSTGASWAWRRGETYPPEHVPDDIDAVCQESLEVLSEQTQHKRISNRKAEHLEALGYL